MIMNSYGFDKTYKQDLFVPNWKRGDKEEARIIGQNDELRSSCSWYVCFNS